MDFQPLLYPIHQAVQARRYRKNSALAVAINAALFSTFSFAQAPSPEAPAIEEVMVFGTGQTRQVQMIDATQLSRLPAGTSPLKAIEKLPGVNFQSGDAYGAYEWSSRITVRGFNQNRLGFTLDGVPLGDMTYGNHNGLHVSRAIASELVESVELSQGAGSLDTASNSNLGGTVKFFSAAPDQEFNIDLHQMMGSDSARHTFASVNTGEFGAGTRAYLALADAKTDKWKGGGEQEHRKVTFKVVQPIGEAELTAYYNDSERSEIDYQDLSKSIVARRGWSWDNWYPDWSSAVAAADACAASGGNNAVVCDDAYWNASGIREDDLWYIGLELPLSSTVSLSTKVYGHENIGQGLWGTPYVPSPGGAPLSVRTTEYDIDRTGIVSSIDVDLGSHQLSAGFWSEDNDFTQARRFYAEPTRTAPTLNFSGLLSNPFRTDWEYDFNTETLVMFVQDVWDVTDAVRLDIGFRSVESENKADTVVGAVKTGKIKAEESFLPQVGINWDVNEDVEWFASAAKNVRTFASSGTSGPFSTSAAGFTAIRDTLEPETSTNLETGIRFRGNSYEAVVAAYHVTFEDRLLGINQGPSIVGNPSVLANVGSVVTKGIETAIDWQISEQVNWFTSIAYTNSEYDDDYTTFSGGVATVVPVGGKKVTDTPELLLKSEVTWEVGSIFTRVDMNYTDERFYTYLNNGGVDDYVLFNGTVGYRLQDIGLFQDVTLQLDATNLMDEEYFSTIDSAGFLVQDPNGTGQTLLGGAPRQFFLSVKAQF